MKQKINFNFLKNIGGFMKKPLRLFATDEAGGGADEATRTEPTIKSESTEPKVETKTIIQQVEPVKSIDELRKEIEESILREYNEKKEKEFQKQKDEELAQLRKEKADMEKKVADMEKANKINEYNIAFKEFAIQSGANKTDTLLKLADRNLKPEEAVSKLKTDLPELFTKSSTIIDIGGGIKSANVSNKTAEEIAKMSISEYKKWREENKNL